MSSIKILSKATLAKRFAAYAGIGVAAIIAYVGINGVVQSNAESKYERKTEVINEAVKKHDTKLAWKVFEEFDQNKVFRDGDKSRFELMIKRAEEAYKLEAEKKSWEEKFSEAANHESVDSARVILKNMKKTGIYGSDEIKRLENRIYDRTEEGMQKRWRYANRNDKISICKSYLAKYINGKFEKEAIKDLLTSGLENIENDIVADKKYIVVFGELEDINSELKRYADKNVKLGEIINANKFVSIAEKYGEKKKNIDTTEALGIDDMVRFTQVKGEWKAQYANERSATIPFGSEGKVVALSERGYMVKFPDIKKYAWTEDWSPDSYYWHNGEKNTSEFRRNEIAKIPEITDIEKNKLMKEVRDLVANLAAYR